MTKSVLAHLVGRAVRDGALALTDAVTGHVPELAGTGYDGTTVLDVLTMTTGVDWVEDHRDPDSLASRLLVCFATGGDSRDLLRSVRPGVAAGHPLELLHRRLAGARLGARARHRTAPTPTTSPGCGRRSAAPATRTSPSTAPASPSPAAASPRPHATGPAWPCWRWTGAATTGERLLDPDWVEAAARPAYPFLAVGRLPSSITTHAGFGYHWWPMDDAGHRVTADGSRGQFACADRRTGAVVVKTSLWPYDDFLVDRQARDLSYLGLHALLDAVSTHHRRRRSTPREPERHDHLRADRRRRHRRPLRARAGDPGADRRVGHRRGARRGHHRAHPRARPRDRQGLARGGLLPRGRRADPRLRRRRHRQHHRRHGRRPGARPARPHDVRRGHRPGQRRRPAPARRGAAPRHLHARLRQPQLRRGQPGLRQHARHAARGRQEDPGARRPRPRWRSSTPVTCGSPTSWSRRG